MLVRTELDASARPLLLRQQRVEVTEEAARRRRAHRVAAIRQKRESAGWNTAQRRSTSCLLASHWSMSGVAAPRRRSDRNGENAHGWPPGREGYLLPVPVPMSAPHLGALSYSSGGQSRGLSPTISGYLFGHPTKSIESSVRRIAGALQVSRWDSDAGVGIVTRTCRASVGQGPGVLRCNHRPDHDDDRRSSIDQSGTSRCPRCRRPLVGGVRRRPFWASIRCQWQPYERSADRRPAGRPSCPPAQLQRGTAYQGECPGLLRRTAWPCDPDPGLRAPQGSAAGQV